MGHLAGWAGDIIAVEKALNFKGALVKLTADETITDATQTNIPWDSAVYDVGSWWSSTPNPTRLTVPADISRVIVSANILWELNNTGRRNILHFKGGNRFEGAGRLRTPAADNSEGNIVSAVIQVSEGDYFECNVLQTSGGNLSVLTAEETWFAIWAFPAIP